MKLDGQWMKLESMDFKGQSILFNGQSSKLNSQSMKLESMNFQGQSMDEVGWATQWNSKDRFDEDCSACLETFKPAVADVRDVFPGKFKAVATYWSDEKPVARKKHENSSD
ncbi:hypothetical protein KM043_010158 [Ampulex compressa]|nr:hypothetical protein KM043_010158 [Ampulex compressa]